MGAFKPPPPPVPPPPAPHAPEAYQVTMGTIALPDRPMQVPRAHAQRPAEDPTERDGRLPPPSIQLLVDPPSPPSDSTHPRFDPQHEPVRVRGR
jgi:hypothetical protein